MVWTGGRIPWTTTTAQLLLLGRRNPAAPRCVRQASSASSLSAQTSTLQIRDGRALLYRGPAPMRNWFYFLIGGIFTGVGVQLSYNFYHHLSWPLMFNRRDNPPQLVSEWKRMIAAFVAGTIGGFSGWLFWATPTKTITKVTLLIPTRQLILRTECREFSALIPRAIYPSPLRKTAELKGYYLTGRNNERIVPLSNVFRIRGSAVGSALSSNVTRVGPTKANTPNNLPIELDARQCLEMKIGNERAWYRLESSGGADPPRKGGYAGFWRRFQHRLRGKTDWEGEMEGKNGLGDKEPWFADRRTFDDVIPLVKRR